MITKYNKSTTTTSSKGVSLSGLMGGIQTLKVALVAALVVALVAALKVALVAAENLANSFREKAETLEVDRDCLSNRLHEKDQELLVLSNQHEVCLRKLEEVAYEEAAALPVAPSTPEKPSEGEKVSDLDKFIQWTGVLVGEVTRAHLKCWKEDGSYCFQVEASYYASNTAKMKQMVAAISVALAAKGWIRRFDSSRRVTIFHKKVTRK